MCLQSCQRPAHNRNETWSNGADGTSLLSDTPVVRLAAEEITPAGWEELAQSSARSRILGQVAVDGKVALRGIFSLIHDGEVSLDRRISTVGGGKQRLTAMPIVNLERSPEALLRILHVDVVAADNRDRGGADPDHQSENSSELRLRASSAR